jgi:hypothetical protein
MIHPFNHGIWESSQAAFKPFTMVVKTDNTGDSNNDQYQLPFFSTHTYNCLVRWGDGSEDTITTWNQAETLHTYSSAGTYTIKISGICTGLTTFTADDTDKLTDITQWGDISWTTFSGAFQNSANLVGSWTDSPDMTLVTNTQAMFDNCPKFIGDVSTFDMSTVTNAKGMFEDDVLFNSDISGWDTSNIDDMSFMLKGCSVFNQNIGGWDTSSCTDMWQMLYNSTLFNQDISSWDISLVTDMRLILTSTAFSTANYDLLLNAWVLLTRTAGVTFNCSANYTTVTSGASRTTIVATPWTVTDAGGI